MNKITYWFKSKWFDWKYRNIDPDVCCCGGSIKRAHWPSCNGVCLSEKEYIKGLYLQGKWK